MGCYRLKPSRRGFLTAAAGTGAAMLLDRARLRAADVDPRAAQIVTRSIVVDMHNHVQIPFLKDPEVARPDPDLDLAGAMKRSGFSAICETYNVDGLQNAQAGDYYKYHLQALAFQDRLLARNHMRRALNMKDLQAAHGQGQPIIIQSAEGAQFMEGRLERVAEAYKRGLRHLQLVHDRDDMVAPLGDIYTAAAHLGGLTPLGAQVVKECNRLGIVVDLAHGSADLVRGVLRVATQPLIYSHTGMDTVLGKGTVSEDMRRRLIGKDLARALAEDDGVIGVWWRLVDSTKEYVAAIKVMVDAVGIDHVGIGTDTDLTASTVLPNTNRIWPDEDGGFFYAVAGEMLKQGFTPDEIGKIGGGNFCRVFAKVTASHA